MKLGKTKPWASTFLRDFGAFSMVIARHFKRKVWRVDKAIALELARREPIPPQRPVHVHRRQRQEPQRLDEAAALDGGDLDKLLTAEEKDISLPTQDELDALFG